MNLSKERVRYMASYFGFIVNNRKHLLSKEIKKLIKNDEKAFKHK